MKQNLVKLLLIEYKQDFLFYELIQKGVDLSGIASSNLSVILDIIGFPAENSITILPGQRDADGNPAISSKNVADADYFCRDWLYEKYYDVSKKLINQQNLSLTNKGLQTESGADNNTVELQLGKYIDWLYDEFLKISQKN